MKVIPLKEEERAGRGGATHVIEITYADLTDGDDAQTIDTLITAAKSAFLLLEAQLKEAFVSSDATLISLAVTVGDAGSSTRYLASMEVSAQAATPVYQKVGALTQLFPYTAAGLVKVAFAATTGKLLSSHTAGRLLLFGIFSDASRSPN